MKTNSCFPASAKMSERLAFAAKKGRKPLQRATEYRTKGSSARKTSGFTHKLNECVHSMHQNTLLKCLERRSSSQKNPPDRNQPSHHGNQTAGDQKEKDKETLDDEVPRPLLSRTTRSPSASAALVANKLLKKHQCVSPPCCQRKSDNTPNDTFRLGLPRVLPLI